MEKICAQVQGVQHRDCFINCMIDIPKIADTYDAMQMKAGKMACR
jgi:hypothetical protein